MTKPQIEVLLSEKREFFPSAQFQSAAHVKDGSLHIQAAQNSVLFWEQQAAQLTW